MPIDCPGSAMYGHLFSFRPLRSEFMSSNIRSKGRVFIASLSLIGILFSIFPLVTILTSYLVRVQYAFRYANVTFFTMEEIVTASNPVKGKGKFASLRLRIPKFPQLYHFSNISQADTESKVSQIPLIS